MKKFLAKWTNGFMVIALFSAFTATSLGIDMAKADDACITGFSVVGDNCVRTYTYNQNAAQTLEIPAGLGAIEIELIGAAGGTGGLDCGAGCVAAESGQVGRVLLSYDDLSGKTINIYPGEVGQDGQSSASNGGGGDGGRSSFNAKFDGGDGGNAGNLGSSGAGAGGGAATVVVIASKQFVAAGGGGGGGSANSVNGATWGNTEDSYVNQGTRGGDGKSSNCSFFCDGGGGGGGGAGLVGGAGGDLYRAPNGNAEAAGYGGAAGTNTKVGGDVIKSNYTDPTGHGKVVIRYLAKLVASAVNLTSKEVTNGTAYSYQMILANNRIFTVDDIKLSGSAVSQTSYKKTITSKRIVKAPYTYNFTISQTGSEKVSGELTVSVFGADAPTVTIDQLAPQATITLQAATQKTKAHIYDVRFDHVPYKLNTTNFAPAGTATGCDVAEIIGGGDYYQVVLDHCTNGTFGLSLLANTVRDEFGNTGPDQNISSELLTASSPITESEISSGEIPKEFLKNLLPKVFGDISQNTKDELAKAGIYAPMASAPTVTMVTDLSSVAVNEEISYQSTQNVDVGSSVKVGIKVSPEVAAVSDVVAFMQTDTVWQYLGRTTFSSDTVTSDAFGIATIGQYKLRLVVIPKGTNTANLSFKTGFGKSAPVMPKTSVSDSQTALSNQSVELTVNAVAGPNGAPVTVEPTSSNTNPVENLLNVSLPSLTVGAPVANPAIGATGDDNAPSVPFDPLGSPESVKAVAKTTATAVAVVSTVAAAAGAAASAAAGAGGSSSSSSSSGSSSNNSSSQETDQSQGEISNIDAQVEAFTSTHLGIGDKLPLFKFKLFNFLDKFSHDLTLAIARFSPVISKIVNDGAYLRAMLGSFYLLFPLAAIGLATVALSEPSVELSPPSWQIFIAIAVLGIFDAFSGLLATTIFAIGMFNSYGIENVSDIRMMLGVLVLGFGPALIAVAFRGIRKHFETNFSYFWERLVDIAVLTFFTGWTVSSMVSTLPALAGRTLQAANHVADFGFYLSIAIVVRIVFEEIAARVFPTRLDRINPTESPETSMLQKLLSTALRLGVFVFVTAAFMGNTWQVWVGSIIFILPNVFSWVEDRLPNYPIIWRLIPSGIPGLAFSLLVASYTSLALGSWLGDHPDYSQYSFMLMPIPMFIVGLIGLFGREGNEDEERFIKRDSLRWVYRFGGIVMLVVTIKLAGVI